TDLHAHVPGAGVLFVAAAIIALAFTHLFWSTPPCQAAKPRDHATAFLSFWRNATGGWRVALFVLAYTCLYLASRAALDEKWVGMASGLPLPGLFALAALIDDTAAEPRTLLAMRDTVFLGPLLVIPFNWTFAHALVAAVPQGALLIRYLLLLAL